MTHLIIHHCYHVLVVFASKLSYALNDKRFIYDATSTVPPLTNIMFHVFCDGAHVYLHQNQYQKNRDMSIRIDIIIILIQSPLISIVAYIALYVYIVMEKILYIIFYNEVLFI